MSRQCGGRAAGHHPGLPRRSGVWQLRRPHGGRISLEAKDRSVSASGLIDGEGRFQLSTFAADDGVPPGVYRVVLAPSGPADDLAAAPAAMFHPRYRSYETSGIEVTIEERRNQLEIRLDPP